MVDLAQLLEEWIATSGFKGLFVNRADLLTSMTDVKAWLNYQDYPINWFCNICNDKIHLFHHNTQFELFATDPKFFEKLNELINHVIVSNDCDICKTEIASNYTNYD